MVYKPIKKFVSPLVRTTHHDFKFKGFPNSGRARCAVDEICVRSIGTSRIKYTVLVTIFWEGLPVPSSAMDLETMIDANLR